MVKTFVVGAEYDDNEMIDIVLRDNDPLMIHLQTSGEVQLRDVLVEMRNSETKEYFSYEVTNPKYINIPVNLYKPGIIQVNVSILDGKSIVKTYTVPPVVVHDTGNRFSGHDVIAKILAALPRIEKLEEEVQTIKTNVEHGNNGLSELKSIVDNMATIVYDPLN